MPQSNKTNTGVPPVGSHKSRAVSSTDVPDGGAGGRQAVQDPRQPGSAMGTTGMPGGGSMGPKGSASTLSGDRELRSPGAGDIELTLTGDQETDFQNIANTYRPSDVDSDMWDGMWRSVLSAESGGNLGEGEAKYGRDKAGAGIRATGPMQVKPSTARGLGFDPEEFDKNPFIKFAAGIKNMREDWDALRERASSPSHRAAMVFASYHAGRGNVIKSLDANGDGIPDVDDGKVNTRDYTQDKLDRLQQYLDTISANRGGIPESEEPVLLTDEEAGANSAIGADNVVGADNAIESGEELTPAKKPTYHSVIPRNPAEQPDNFDEYLNEQDRKLREELGLIAPENYPHKVAKEPVKVAFELQPGQELTQQMIADAVTNSLTGDPQMAAKFRQAVGEDPGGFLDPTEGKAWLQRQMEAGNINITDAGGRMIVQANIPVQSYVIRRINALAKGGVPEVEAETVRMRQEITAEERRAAEVRYGQEIAELNKQADDADLAAETKAIRELGGVRGGTLEVLRDVDPFRFLGADKPQETEEGKRLRAQAAALEAELERRFPTTQIEEIGRGIKRTIANVAQQYRNLERNIKNIGEAVVYTNDKEYARQMAIRDRQYKKATAALARATPDTRRTLGGAVEAIASAAAFDAPVYLAGGAVFGPSGLIYTTAIRSADKDINEFTKDIAAALFEIPISKGIGSLISKGGYKYGVQEAGEKLIGRIASEGLGEVGGDAVIQYFDGKKLDWQEAFKNFVAGGAFGISGGGKSKEGERTAPLEEVPIVPISPMGVTIGEDGNNRYQIVLKQGEDTGLVELPPDHPIVIKYAAQAEAGGVPFLAFSNEQFDQALNDFKGTGKAKLPKMTGEQFQKYLQGVNKNENVRQADNGLAVVPEGTQRSEVGQVQAEKQEQGQVERQEEIQEQDAGDEGVGGQAVLGKRKVKYRDEEIELDEDLADQFDDNTRQVKETIATAKAQMPKDVSDSVSKSQGYAQTAFRKGLIEQQKKRDNEAAIQKAKLSSGEQTILSSAYKKLGVNSATDASKIIQTAAKRFQKKLKGTQAEKDGIEAQERLESLTADEQRALSKVLPEAFAAPVKAAQPDVEGEEGTSRRIESMTSEEFEREPQLVANEKAAEEFFDKAKKGEIDTATTAEEQAEREETSKKFEEDQKSIKKGDLKIKRNGVEITLPKKLAQQWQQADLEFDTESRKLQQEKGLSVVEKGRKLKSIQAKRKAARDRIFSQYQILEEQQTKRGYIKGSNAPVTIVEEVGDKYIIREPSKEGTREVLKETVETAKERGLRREKKAKLPIRVRAKKALGGFEEGEDASFAKDGVVYINDTLKNKIEDAIGYEVEDGQTFSNENMPKLTKMLRAKGLDKLAKQLEQQAKGRAGAAIVPVSSEDSGISRFHEQIHTVAYDKQLSEAAVDGLYREGTNVSKLIDELLTSDNESVREIALLNPYDLVQEILAYGLTGDFETLGVSADTLYDALLDVAEEYLREFPNETLANIAEYALINFDKIRQEAESRIKKEAKDATTKDTGKSSPDKDTQRVKERKTSKREKDASELLEAERADVINKVTKAQKEDTTKRRQASLAKMRRDTNPNFDPKTQLDVNEELEAIAQDYNKKAGRSEYKVDKYYNFKPEVYNKIADLMETLPHQPTHPDVVATYKALAEETVAQYKHILEAGYVMEPWQQEGQPYTDSKAMRKDVIENKHLYFFLGSDMDPAHPMAQYSGVNIGDYPASVNDIFRAVHDFFGHAVSGAQFGARGELNATDSHARMYSPEALPAMIGETVFQNAWVNYGPHIRRPDGSIPVKGDSDFFPPDQRPYAEQKAMNITPDHVQLWISAYTETPERFSLARRTAKANEKIKKETKTKKKKVDPAVQVDLDRIHRKQADELTPEDIQTIIQTGKFAVLSGNTANLEAGEAAVRRGKLKNENLKRELEKMGYKVLRADGVYAPTDAEPNVEPSVFVLLQGPLDIANIIRLGTRYRQAQVLIGDGGEFRAPFTMNVESGKKGTENYGGNTVMFGKDAEEQVGKTRVKIGGKDFTFSVPDTFDKTRKQAEQELRYVKELTNAYKKSFGNRLIGTTVDLFKFLKQRDIDGKRQDINKEEAAKVLEKMTKQVAGAPPKTVEKPKGSKTEADIKTAAFNAVRARRARADAMAILKDRLFGRGERQTDDETGLSWYAAAIRRMHQITGQAFPEVLNVPQLRALFDLTLALSSQGNKVKDNFRYTVDLWMRMITEFQLGREGTENTYPTKLKESKKYKFKGQERESTNYGRFGPQLEKFNLLTQGFIPVPTGELDDLRAKGAEIKQTKEFEKVNGATQWFYKDPELVEDIKKYGHLGGVFEYLLKPGKSPNNPYRSTEILGPKIGAFFLNIAGFSQLVTVDMWATRWFYRVNGGLLDSKGEIQDAPVNTSDGDLIRGVMQATANEWNKLYGDKIKLAPADVQAILWYAEKDIWHLVGADDTGTIDFATAAQETIDQGRNNPELFGDIDGTSNYREKVVADFVNSAPSIGKGLQGFGTKEATEANRNFFITQMAVPARIGLASTTRKQLQNRKLLNFDAQEWNRLAEHAHGKPLDQQQTNDLYNLLQFGYSAQTKADKEEAIKNLNNFVDDLSGQSLPDFIMSALRAGMLSGIRTTARNISSNLAFAVLEEGRRGTAAPMDVIIAAMSPSGERAVQGISPRGVSFALKKALTDGFKQFWKTLIHGDPGAAYETFSPGYDPKVRASIFTFGKTGASFLNHTVGNFAKYIFRFQQAQDNVFRTYAYNRSMYELAALSEKNGGRPLQDVLTNPTVEESDMAWRAAESAVFQSDNPINTAYQRAKSKAPDPVRWLLDYELPFVKTGSNIFIETMNYSVFGLLWGGAKGVTELGKNLKSGGWQKAQQELWNAIDTPEIRRTIINTFSKGLVGTGIATIGFWLASKGLLYGMGGDEDEKERNRRIAQGAGPGHLYAGGEWHDLRGLSPVGTILISGASYWHALNKEMKSEDSWRRMDEVMKTISAMVIDGLPMARAFQDFTNPRSGVSMAQRFIGADRIVPAIVGDVASIQDDVVREAKGDTLGENIKASIQKKIPNTPVTRNFNRQGLPAKTDIFNRAVEQANPFNPVGSKKDRTNKIVEEAKEVGWSFSAPKIDTKNKETRAAFNERRSKTQDMFGRVFDAVINDKEYPKELPKEERKKILEDSAAVARKAIKREEPLTKEEMKEIVDQLIGSAKEKAEVSKDVDLTEPEKKEVRKKIASSYSKTINKVLGIQE